MNKNWLYRILAIALVAMLALPMFAMAEEAETFDLGGEEGVELVEKTPYEEVDGEVPPLFPVGDPLWLYDFTLGSATTDITVDLANPEHCTVFAFEADGLKKGFSKKNSNSKVLTVSSNGVITLKAKGKATVTFSGTNVFGNKVSLKINFTVKNSADFSLKADDDLTVIGTAVATGRVIPVFKYENDDGEVVNYVDDFGGVLDETSVSWFVTFKSSSTSVAKIGYRTGLLEPKKAGSVTITATLYRYDGDLDVLRRTNFKVATATLKIKPVANKWTNTKEHEKTALNAAKKDEDIYIGVRSAEFTKTYWKDTAETPEDPDDDELLGDLKVVLYVANGTSNSINKIYGGDDWDKDKDKVMDDDFIPCTITLSGHRYDYLRDLELGQNSVEDIVLLPETTYLNHNKSMSVSWKKNAKSISTMTLTFKDVPVVNLSGDLKEILVDSFYYKTAKKQLIPDQIWMKRF